MSAQRNLITLSQTLNYINLNKFKDLEIHGLVID